MCMWSVHLKNGPSVMAHTVQSCHALSVDSSFSLTREVVKPKTLGPYTRPLIHIGLAGVDFYQ